MIPETVQQTLDRQREAEIERLRASNRLIYLDPSRPWGRAAFRLNMKMEDLTEENMAWKPNCP